TSGWIDSRREDRERSRSTSGPSLNPALSASHGDYKVGILVGLVTPQALARYQIQGEIGRGMMGVVYRAFDPALGRIVALKTVQSVFPLPAEQQKAFEERFLSEARVAAGLSHPAIVVVHDVGRDPES